MYNSVSRKLTLDISVRGFSRFPNPDPFVLLVVEQVARETKISFSPCLSDCWIIYFNCGPEHPASARTLWVRWSNLKKLYILRGFCAYQQHTDLEWDCLVPQTTDILQFCFFCYSVFKYPSWLRASVLIQLQLCLLTGRVVTKGGLGLGNNSSTGIKALLPTRFSLAWSLYFSAD